MGKRKQVQVPVEKIEEQNRFIEAIADEANFTSNIKFTENGAVALSSTGNSLLDFYATSGALRKRNEAEIIDLFKKAYGEKASCGQRFKYDVGRAWREGCHFLERQ